MLSTNNYIFRTLPLAFNLRLFCSQMKHLTSLYTRTFVIWYMCIGKISFVSKIVWYIFECIKNLIETYTLVGLNQLSKCRYSTTKTFCARCTTKSLSMAIQ